jgi:hypothetical protein
MHFWSFMSNLRKSPQSHTPNPQWMSVFTAYHLSEAQIVAGRLQHEGIPALVTYPTGGMAMGIYLGEVHVLVHPEHYARAISILDPEALDELPDSTDDITYLWDDPNEPYDDER